MSIKVFSAQYLDELVRLAKASPRRRQHRNIHVDYADPCQRLFNAIEPDSYLRPHQHSAAQGAETMIAIRGLLALIIFDEEGKIAQVQRFGSGSDVSNRDVTAGVETPADKWHTLVSLESGSIILEVKAGPFNPSAPKFPAPWAPEERSSEAGIYLKEIRQAVSLFAGRSPTV